MKRQSKRISSKYGSKYKGGDEKAICKECKEPITGLDFHTKCLKCNQSVHIDCIEKDEKNQFCDGCFDKFNAVKDKIMNNASFMRD